VKDVLKPFYPLCLAAKIVVLKIHVILLRMDVFSNRPNCSKAIINNSKNSIELTSFRNQNHIYWCCFDSDTSQGNELVVVVIGGMVFTLARSISVPFMTEFPP